MSKIKIDKKFHQIKRRLMTSLPSVARGRLLSVHLRLIRKPAVPWVAYFDANRDTIVLNQSRLAGRSPHFLTMLLFHELLHAAGGHSRRQLGRAVALKAGLRLETYNPKTGKRTKNAHLNEAFVSLLTRRQCGAWDAHYILEQLVLEALIRKVGLAPLSQAFFAQDVTALDRQLHERVGERRAADILAAFERRRFDTLQPYLFGAR